MKLILVRHGEANAVNHTSIKTDAQRTLTALGLKQAQQTADWINKHYKPDLLIVSPYVRARQTMQTIEQACNQQAQVCDIITPMDDDKLGLDHISDKAEQQQAQCVVVVCHMNIVAHMHARATGLSFQPFSLAEARVLEQHIIADGLSKELQYFIPDV